MPDVPPGAASRSARTGKPIAALILVFWLFMVGWQVRREYFRPELTRLAEAARSLAPGVNFYTVRMGDRAIGLATSRLDTLPTGFVLEDLLSLELPALGQSGSAVVRTRVDLDPALVMRAFSFSLDSEVGRFAASGDVEGDTLLSVELDAGGETTRTEYRLGEPPVFSAVLPIRVAVGGALEKGARLALPVFDPTSLSTRTVEVRVIEHDTLAVPDSAALDPATGRWSPVHYDSVPAWRIEETFGGVRMDSWIDEDGRIVRSSSALGFTMERTEYELARQARDDSRGLAAGVDDDIILTTAIRSTVDLESVERHRRIAFRLAGVDLSGFDLDGGRQVLDGDTLVVEREEWGALPTYDLPYKRMDLREALEPEPLIQSDDDRIVRAARRAAGWRQFRSLDAKETAERLTAAVHRMLDKEITISVPNAVQVLESGQGDCNEHTVLFVAMARALWGPAPTAVGLVYVDGSFFYHAWPEVWLDGWVAVDPTFGQHPADAAHIRFVNGGLAQQVEIVRLIGNLDIEILSATRDPGVAGERP